MPAGGNEVEYFLKVDGIQGESVDPKHKDEIELISYGWGLAQASTSGAGPGERRQAPPHERVVHESLARRQILRLASRGGTC